MTVGQKRRHLTGYGRDAASGRYIRAVHVVRANDHNHLSVAAFDPVGVDCSTPPQQSIAEVLASIEAHCRGLPAGQWAMGSGFVHVHVREQRNPTRQEVDEVTPHNPFFLRDTSCHAGYANTAALRSAGITAHAPQPWGGEFEKDRTVSRPARSGKQRSTGCTRRVPGDGDHRSRRHVGHHQGS